MVTKEDLVKKYSSFTDEQLFHVYANISAYSELAKEALERVINQKGGLDIFIVRKKRYDEELSERCRIKNQVIKFNIENFDEAFIKENIESNILSKEETNTIINESLIKLTKEKTDRKIARLYRIVLFCYLSPFIFILLFIIDVNTFHATDVYLFVPFILTLFPLSIIGMIYNILGLKLSYKMNRVQKKNMGYANLIVGIILLMVVLMGFGLAFVMTF